MAKPKSFAFGPGEFVALVGYRGDGIVRILRVESFDETYVRGIDLLRSSPTEPVHRDYFIDKVDRFAPVVGQQDG